MKVDEEGSLRTSKKAAVNVRKEGNVKDCEPARVVQWDESMSFEYLPGLEEVQVFLFSSQTLRGTQLIGAVAVSLKTVAQRNSRSFAGSVPLVSKKKDESTRPGTLRLTISLVNNSASPESSELLFNIPDASLVSQALFPDKRSISRTFTQLSPGRNATEKSKQTRTVRIQEEPLHADSSDGRSSGDMRADVAYDSGDDNFADEDTPYDTKGFRLSRETTTASETRKSLRNAALSPHLRTKRNNRRSKTSAAQAARPPEVPPLKLPVSRIAQRRRTMKEDAGPDTAAPKARHGTRRKTGHRECNTKEYAESFFC